MLRTVFAAATLAAIAASASSAFAQEGRLNVRNPGLDLVANRNLTLRENATPRIAIDPGANRQIVVEPGNGPNGQPPRQNLVINPGQPNPPQDVAVNPGNPGDQVGQQNLVINPGQPNPPQDVAVNPGNPGNDFGREPPRQNIVINPGQPNPPQIVVDAGRPQADPQRPATVVNPGLPQTQGPAFIDTAQQLIEDDLPAAAPQADAPALPTEQAQAPAAGQWLEPWQVEFRLGQEGFREVQFVDRNDKYFFVLADAGNYRGLTYLLAVDGYTGAVVSAREINLEAQRYTTPVQNYAPRYSYSPRYEGGYRYSVNGDDCDEYGRRY